MIRRAGQKGSSGERRYFAQVMADRVIVPQDALLALNFGGQNAVALTETTDGLEIRKVDLGGQRYKTGDAHPNR